jgi:hypothetical protein
MAARSAGGIIGSGAHLVHGCPSCLPGAKKISVSTADQVDRGVVSRQFREAHRDRRMIGQPVTDRRGRLMGLSSLLAVRVGQLAIGSRALVIVAPVRIGGQQDSPVPGRARSRSGRRAPIA